MRADRIFFVGPVMPEEKKNGDRKLQDLATTKYWWLDSKRVERTGHENAFLKVCKLKKGGKDKINLGDATVTWAAFLQELCKAVTESEATVSPEDYKSLLHELAQYLLASIFRQNIGGTKTHHIKFLEKVKLIEFSKKDDGELLVRKCLHVFLTRVFGGQTHTPPVSLYWIKSFYMFDKLFEIKGSADARKGQLRFLFTKTLLHTGDDSPPLIGNDNFLDHILEVCGEVETGEIAGDGNSPESTRVRSLQYRVRSLEHGFERVKDYLANPSGANFRRLPTEITAGALALPDASQQKDLRDIASHLLVHLDDPWTVYFAAKESAELLNDDTIVVMARDQLELHASKLQLPRETFESIEDHMSAVYEAARAEQRSSSVAIDTTDESHDVDSTSDDVEAGSEASAVDVSDSISDIGNVADNDQNYIVHAEHPEIYFTLPKYQKLNRLFTAEGIELPGKKLFSQDRLQDQHFGGYNPRYAFQSGGYLRLEDFTIVKKLGAGSEGLVCAMYYKDIANDMLVAGKLLVLANEVEYRKYYERSTKKWAELNGHPNFIQFLGFALVDTLDGLPVNIGGGKIMMMQIMEFCVCTLEDALKTKHKETTTDVLYEETYCPFVLDTFGDLLDGLDAMKALQIVHRDV